MLTRIKKKFQFYWFFFRTLFVRFRQDACFVWAASLSYATLLSLIPLLASSLIVIKAFPAFKSMENQLEEFLVSHFVAGSAKAIQIYIHQFLKQALTLSVMGSMALVVTAVLLIFSMEKAFNHIWKIRQHRRGVSAFLMYWGVLTLLPVLVAVGLAMVKSLALLPIFQLASKNPPAVFSVCIAFILTWLIFIFLYIGVPNCKVKARYAMLGACVSAILFECAKNFSVYLLYFSNYEVIYGSVAVIPLFLVWLYIVWLIILFGVQVTHVLQHKTYRAFYELTGD